MPKPPRVVVSAEPHSDGLLSIVQVYDGGCVLSNGHELLIKWSKLQTLAEQICQDGVPIWIRIWTTPDGDELIELRRARVGEPSIDTSTDTTLPADCESF